MEVIRIDYLHVQENLPKSSCCIGFFDGLHTGHQALLENCIAKAKELNIQSGLITFDPDPWKIFFPDCVCRHITTLEDRIHLHAACVYIARSVLVGQFLLFSLCSKRF